MAPGARKDPASGEGAKFRECSGYEKPSHHFSGSHFDDPAIIGKAKCAKPTAIGDADNLRPSASSGEVSLKYLIYFEVRYHVCTPCY